MPTKSNVLGPSTALSGVLSNISDPASLPVPLGKSLPCLGHQLSRCFLSSPLDVTHSECSGGHCLGLGDSSQGIGSSGKQVRHSSFRRRFGFTRRGRVGAVGLSLLPLERSRLCSPEVALWSLYMKGSTFQTQKQEAF